MQNSILVGTAMAAALVGPTFAHAQIRTFDGNWSVEVVTEKGSCDRAYRYSIVIANGRARYGGSEDFAISGQVRSNGQVSGSISRGSDRANVTGRLAGTQGTGTWTTSGGRACSGTWNAEKRN